MDAIIVTLCIYGSLVFCCHFGNYIKNKLDNYYRKKYSNLDEYIELENNEKKYKPDADSDDEEYTSVLSED